MSNAGAGIGFFKSGVACKNFLCATHRYLSTTQFTLFWRYKCGARVGEIAPQMSLPLEAPGQMLTKARLSYLYLLIPQRSFVLNSPIRFFFFLSLTKYWDCFIILTRYLEILQSLFSCSFFNVFRNCCFENFPYLFDRTRRKITYFEQTFLLSTRIIAEDDWASDSSLLAFHLMQYWYM